MKNWEKKFKTTQQGEAPMGLPSTDGIVASVLVPIGLRNNAAQHEILLTKRSETVETHKGQVSFPGGLFEAEDKDILKTALRETFEEVGISESQIHVLGSLPPVKTLNDVVIYPWVAKVEFPDMFSFNPHEVDRLLFLPLEHLLTEGLKPVQVKVQEQGISFTVSSVGLNWDNELIWGASAQILNHLVQSLREG
jgi:8-oxo-dGTP pyrophosphatase MutT (NUDIX family)